MITTQQNDLARDIISALRSGTVPNDGLHRIAVGCETLLEHFLKQFDYVAEGKSEVKFIRGAYGAGKSFLCALIREAALERNFVATTVVISPETPIGELDIYYAKIADGLRTKEKRSGSAMIDVLEQWLLLLHRKVAMIEGIDDSIKVEKKRLAELVGIKIEQELSAISDLNPAFASAVRSYYLARTSRNSELARNAAAWLRGSKTIPLQMRRMMGVQGDLRPEDAFNQLGALLLIIRGAGYRGMVVITDEVETVQRLPLRQKREEAFEALRVIVDTAGENGFPGCLFVFTGTDRFFEDHHAGIPSYEALANRILKPETFKELNSIRQPIICLPGFDRSRLLKVAIKIRNIHAQAYNWEPAGKLTETFLERFAEEMSTSFGEEIERVPRGFLREIVHLCDLVEDHPDLEPSTCLDKQSDLVSRLRHVQSEPAHLSN